MKVNTITKKCIYITLTIGELKDSLKNYQLDHLKDISSSLKSSASSESYESNHWIFWNLLQGENSEYFLDMCEKHGVYWINTPSDITGWGSLVEEFPAIFIKDFYNLLENVFPANLEVTLYRNETNLCDSYSLNSSTILNKL